MENDIRPLTREEQLEWYIEFLKEQKALLEELLIQSENELKLVKKGKPIIKEEYTKRLLKK